MSNLIESLFNQSFTIERISRTGDGHGNFPEIYSPLGSVVGRIRPASSAEREAAAQQSREISHVLYVAAGTDIGRGDRVTCGDLVVEVRGMRNPSKADHHLEIDCLEIQKEVTD